MKKSIDITVKPGRRREHKKHVKHVPSGDCCRTHMVVCAGYGDEKFKLPTVERAVIGSLERLEKRYQGKQAPKVPATAGGANEEGATGSAAKHDHTHVVRMDRGLLGIGLEGLPKNPSVAPLIPQLPESKESGVDATLFAAAEGLRLIMDDGKYDAIVAERFDDETDKVTWAIANLPAKFKKPYESLGEHLEQLKELYREALPRVLSVLVAQNPEVPKGRLLQAALDTLDEEVSPLLNTLRIWSDAAGQLRGGRYNRQINAVINTLESAFRLFEGEEPKSECEPGKNCQQRLKTAIFHVGNVFVGRFSDQGPATLPGRGPIGAHAVEIPHDERHIITLMLVLYMHEFRHDIFHDVEGLAEELTVTVAKAIKEAHDKGELKFDEDKIVIGRQKVRTVDLLTKLFAADNIGEIDADISGGVLLSGPAFLYNMLSTFSAFNTKGRGVFNSERLLRTSSYYELTPQENGQVSLDFFPHPPDFIRAHIVAAALDEIGFPAEARQCRLLADQAVGQPLPEYITWEDANGKSKAVIKIKVEDIKKVAPIVAKALIRTKLQSLGGLSTSEVIYWTPKRQAKVDLLVANLMAGKSDVPADKGDFFPTYVAAAATLAYWGLVKSGVQPRQAAASVEANALIMIDIVREREEKAAAAQAAAATPAVSPGNAGTAGGDTAAPASK